jgi:hypothetical protein
MGLWHYEMGLWHYEMGLWHYEMGLWHYEMGLWHYVSPSPPSLSPPPLPPPLAPSFRPRRDEYREGDIHTDTDTFTHAYQDTFTLAAYSEDRERSIKGVGLVVSCLCDAGRWAPRASAARLAGSNVWLSFKSCRLLEL